MSEAIDRFAQNLVKTARGQVNRTWGESAADRLGGHLYKGLIAQSAFLALVSHSEHSDITDAEVREAVSAVWKEMRRQP